MLNAIHHELGHAVVGRRQGYQLTSFEIENTGHEIFHGQSGIQYADETPYQLVLLSFFAGPLTEARFLGDSAAIDMDRSFIPLAVANQKLVTPVRFVGAAAPVGVSRDVFSDDWNVASSLIKSAIERGDQVIHLELFLTVLKAAIQFVNDDANWTIIAAAAEAIGAEDVLASLAPGHTANLLARATELLAEVPFG